MADVAVLGTGRMGAAMALRLARAGHALTVWNRTPATAQAVVAMLPGGAARTAATPGEAVRGQSAVLTAFADGGITRDVLLDTQVLAGLAAGCVVCDLGTSGVAAAQTLAAGVTGVGAMFVDAPVSGSVPAVEAGTLLVMAGGDPTAVDAARPVLEAFARRVVRVGGVGTGQAMKLAVNLVVHDLNAALSEALVLAENAGIQRESAYDIMADSVVGAPFFAYKRAAFLDPDTPVAMSLDLVLKDLRLITSYAEQLGAAHEVTTAAESAVDQACEAGYGTRDMADLSRYLDGRTGP